ncbi:MAG: DUF3293 domain-containing protein, partial [Verrucomicrobiales bacterium]
MEEPPLPAVYGTTRFLVDELPRLEERKFAIITACNPMDRRFSERMNRKADRRLRRLLERRHLHPTRA